MPDDRNMRERLARIVYGTRTCTHFDELEPATKRLMFERADAILDELRNPTEAMIDAMVDEWHDGRLALLDDQLKAIFGKAIDAAKQERG